MCTRMMVTIFCTAGTSVDWNFDSLVVDKASKKKGRR